MQKVKSRHDLKLGHIDLILVWHWPIHQRSPWVWLGHPSSNSNKTCHHQRSKTQKQKWPLWPWKWGQGHFWHMLWKVLVRCIYGVKHMTLGYLLRQKSVICPPHWINIAVMNFGLQIRGHKSWWPNFGSPKRYCPKVSPCKNRSSWASRWQNVPPKKKLWTYGWTPSYGIW